jgi:hypothetical protein
MVAAYKERKSQVGVYAVRCAATGEVWVGSSPNLDKIQNRHWFSLKMGSHTLKPLQAVWKAHGADSFTYEVLETLDEEADAYVRASRLKERLTHWRQSLSAQSI